MSWSRRIAVGALLVCAYVILWTVPRAIAAPSTAYTNQCPDPAATSTVDPAVATSCAAVAERVEDLESTTAASEAALHRDLMVLLGAVLGAGFLPPLLVHLFGGRGK